jgi:hypothetical protein
MPMPIDINIRSFFTRKVIAQRIEASAKLVTPILSLVYKRKKQHPYPTIGVNVIKRVIQNVPVVRRGSSAVPMRRKGFSTDIINPQGIDTLDFLSATDINNLKLLDTTNTQALVNGIVDDMLLTSKKTTEALCAQSLKGVIRYPMKSDDGDEPYELSYITQQDVHQYTGGQFTSSSTIKTVFEAFTEMETMIQDDGWGGNIEILAGKDVYSQLLEICETKSTKNNHIKVRIDKKSIDIGGFTVRQVNASYKGYTSDTGTEIGTVKEIPEKSLVMIDLDAPHTLFYLALDDLKAGMQALPFFAAPGEVKDNPSGIEIIGRSKPIPAPVINAICWFESAVE